MLKKKPLLLLFIVFLLQGCERPATRTDWSPINDATPPVEINKDLEGSFGNERLGLTSFTLPTHVWENLPTQFPPSMKGVELVSWQTGEDWNFTLVTGTNREKTFEELTSPETILSETGDFKISVTGVEDLKRVLGLLSGGEEVIWSGMDLAGEVPSGTIYFAYPPQEIMDEVAVFCEENGIILYTLPGPE